MQLGYIHGVRNIPGNMKHSRSHNIELCFHDHHWFSIANIVENAVASPNLVAIAFRVKVRMMITSLTKSQFEVFACLWSCVA
jgi:hypothetical protein